MRAFRLNQRVVVDQVDDVRFEPGRPGRVKRLLIAKSAAWVELDKRLEIPELHPFPADDDRGRDVRVWPEQCSPIRATQRRGKDRDG
jgi:hypothetical protein